MLAVINDEDSDDDDRCDDDDSSPRDVIVSPFVNVLSSPDRPPPPPRTARGESATAVVVVVDLEGTMRDEQEEGAGGGGGGAVRPSGAMQDPPPPPPPPPSAAVGEGRDGAGASSFDEAPSSSSPARTTTKGANGAAAALPPTTPAPTSPVVAAPGTDPVLRYMARPSPPVSAAKTPRDDDRRRRRRDAGGGGKTVAFRFEEETEEVEEKEEEEEEDFLVTTVKRLSKESMPQEQYLAVQALVQFAKEGADDGQWDVHFDDVLDCLLDGIGPPRSQRDRDALSSLSPRDKDQLSRANDLLASKHLYLQGIRALLKYRPDHFEGRVGGVIGKLLQCAKCSAYEVVHTAERALENIVSTHDPELCLDALLPYLNDDDVLDGNDEIENGTPSVVLCALRTATKLVKRVRPEALLDALPSLAPCLYASVRHRAVDMRKAAVFVVVELYFAIGGDVLSRLDRLNAAQLKLVSIYIERHRKEGRDVGGGGVGGNVAARTAGGDGGTVAERRRRSAGKSGIAS